MLNLVQSHRLIVDAFCFAIRFADLQEYLVGLLTILFVDLWEWAYAFGISTDDLDFQGRHFV